MDGILIRVIISNKYIENVTRIIIDVKIEWGYAIILLKDYIVLQFKEFNSAMLFSINCSSYSIVSATFSSMFL